MATPPSSPPPPPPTGAASQLPSTLKRTRKATRLRTLATRPVWVERLLVHVDLATGKVDGSNKKKLRTYLGIVARDKNSLEEQASQGSFDAHGRQDVLTAAIERPEHPGRGVLLELVSRSSNTLDWLQGPLARIPPWLPKTWSS
ncbi:hypothetical protein GmHk_10G028958 [Glycine max]|nr:hypothetical protein GmHk_10G028958 [Glycine max]